VNVEGKVRVEKKHGGKEEKERRRNTRRKKVSFGGLFVSLWEVLNSQHRALKKKTKGGREKRK